jgi:C-terminal processing protease CtpA/Prc
MPGDVITKIGDESIDRLIKKYLPITPGSNYWTQLRDLPSYYLLRTNKKLVELQILRDGKKKSLALDAIPLQSSEDSSSIKKVPEYSIIPGNIGYLFAGKYRNGDLLKIENLFNKTKGIIIDMRCYPSDFMPYTLVPFIKSGNAPFVLSTYPNIYNPGLFKFGSPLVNNGKGLYTGKVIIIVDENTQSQGEYTTMAFQSSKNVIVIGSPTAGADGNVDPIILPGGLRTYISGIGVRYPDNKETQRTGIKIDYIFKSTINAVKKGEDEQLKKAIEMIQNQ